MEVEDINKKLVDDLSQLIEDSRKQIATAASSAIAFLYWKIGRRINKEILKNKRADYGKQIVVSLSRQLSIYYGKSFEVKNLRRMIQFAQIFQDEQNVVSLIRQLSWSHIIVLIPIKDSLQREFYARICKVEKWNVRTLRQKIDGMLFERTAISKKPDKLIAKELKKLAQENSLSPDLVFRDPYFLDFTGLSDSYSEKSLEDAILQELEKFILELGVGFTFVERQKRMIIDGEDYYLDLLFYHRKLKRLIAIELKLGKFKAAYKGQMELYLRWLEKNESQADEEKPLGLILCAEGNHEQIELLQLQRSGIRAAEYLTELPDKKVLKQKLHSAIEKSKKRLENNGKNIHGRN